MPTVCAAYNCTYRHKKGDNISLHQFPKDPELKTKWLQAMRRLNYVPSNTARLCSQHFLETDFIIQFGKKLLKNGAVPTVFKFPKHLMKSPAKPRSTRLQKKDAAVSPNISPKSCTIDPELPAEGEQLYVQATPSTSRNLEQSLALTENCGLPSTSFSSRKRKNFVYFGDCKEDDLRDPKKAKLMWGIAKETIRKQRKTIKYLHTRNRRLQAKVKTLGEIVNHLKNTQRISVDSYMVLQETLPPAQRQLFLRQLKVTTKRQYPPELRSFALTLNFYSSAAYDYVRTVFGKCLPHPSTLRKWYSSIDGSPGYTRESLNAIKLKVAEMQEKGVPLICSLMVDEMSVKQHVELVGEKEVGYIDYGCGFGDNDSLPQATYAIVFLLVAINARWKIPLGYFLITKLSSEEKANLIKGCFAMLNDTGVKVISITFDGAPTNIGMAELLGVNLTWPNLKTFFPHPVTGEKVFVILDACHMIKLVRNTLGDFGELLDGQQQRIRWQFFKEIVAIQDASQLMMGTKIRQRHINYFREKMKVKLAVQIFSQSVADALNYCNQDLRLPQFIGAEATSRFCFMINKAFDILNSRNNLSRQIFKKGVSAQTCHSVNSFIDEFVTYISSITTKDNINILLSRRKLGFLGLIVDLISVQQIVQEYIVEQGTLKYLLTYKLSQDHLELFFSSIRARGGFNNNPTPRQFQGAYKRLLVHVELKTSQNTNCEAFDSISILHVTSAQKIPTLDILKDISDQIDEDECDNYITLPDTLPDIDCDFISDVVTYIAGFVCAKLVKRLECSICSDSLLSTVSDSALLNRKNRGGLTKPSKDVIIICKYAERVFRQQKNIALKDINKLVLTATREINFTNLFLNLRDHLLDQDPINNHLNLLIYLILKQYFIIKTHHFNQTLNEAKQRIRAQFTKLIHFKHQ